MENDDFDRVYAATTGILETVQDQLKFAEAKNGALLTVNVAVVVGISAVLSATDNPAQSIVWWMVITAVLLLCASLVSLASFLPIHGDARMDFNRGTASGGKSLVFWGEIANFSSESYTAAILAAFGINEPGGTALIADVCDQIVVNSGIAKRKFLRFQTAARITMAAIVIPAVVFAGTCVGRGVAF